MRLAVQRFLQDEHITPFSRMSFTKNMFFGTLQAFSSCNNLNFLSKKRGSRVGSALFSETKRLSPFVSDAAKISRKVVH